MERFYRNSLFVYASLAFFLLLFVGAYTYYTRANSISIVGVLPAEKSEPVFQPDTLSWTIATSSAEWAPRDSSASFVFAGKMWTMGGLNGNENIAGQGVVRYWEAPHFNDIWASENGTQWTLVKEHAEWSPRRSMSVLFFNGALWMFGGWSPVGGYTSDVWRSEDGIVWTRVVVRAPWSPREGQTAEVFAGNMWMFGGVNYDERTTKNDAWYSGDGMNWYEATTTIPWSPRWDHATAVFHGKIFLGGGMNLAKETFQDVWVSGDGLAWERATSSAPWSPRQGHAFVVLRDTLWSVGRLNDKENGGENDVWYSPDGTSWYHTKELPAWAGREDHSTLVFNDEIFVFGGMDANWQWRNDVWVSSFGIKLYGNTIKQ